MIIKGAVYRLYMGVPRNRLQEHGCLKPFFDSSGRLGRFHRVTDRSKIANGAIRPIHGPIKSTVASTKIGGPSL